MSRRRIRGEGSIYQRESDGRWVGVVDMGWVEGRRVRKTVTARTRKELVPKFEKLKAQIAAGVVADDVTVGRWLDVWLDDIASKKNRPSTMRGYRMYVERWIKPSIGHLRLDRLRAEHVRALYAHMENRGLADNTRRNIHNVLHRALKIAEREGRIPYNPASRVDPPSAGKNKHGKLTLAEAKQVLAFLDGRDDCARWTVALLAGLRQGEALGLRWEDVDLDLGLIHVRHEAQRIIGQGIRLVPLKSKSSERVVPMVPPVHFALSALPTREGYVFGGEKLIDGKTDWRRWRDMLKDAGVEHHPLHAARATTASLLHEAGVPAKIIAEILGHARPEVTEDHYIIGDVEVHRKAMAQLGALVAA